MDSNRILTAALLALALIPFGAQAQEPASAPAIGLQVDGGSVLVSTGGEFVQATPGQVIQPGHRVMVAEGGSASLNYGGGCSKALTQPGVYTVNADCNIASSRGSVSTGKVVAGALGGVAVIAAAAGGGGGSDDDSRPISR